MSTKPAPKDDKEPAKAAQTAPEPAAKAPATTAIKVLSMHPKLGCWPGETTTINADLAAELIAGGFAEKVK